MKTFLMVFLVSLALGAAFTGSSYFVTSEEDVSFACYVGPADLHQQGYNTYKETKNGFLFDYYVKDSEPKAGGCTQAGPKADGTPIDVVASSKFLAVEFAKDFAVWSTAFLILGIFTFGVRKKQ
jgi:hypothetical protein